MNEKLNLDHRAARVLVLIEGRYDICFLKTISGILHQHDASLPNLSAMEAQGQLVFIPIGGSVQLWIDRLQPCGIAEFHLYDREAEPETSLRRKIVNQINDRQNCHAVMTRKRSLENYLHPQAIAKAGNFLIQFDDFEPVAELVAQHKYQTTSSTRCWDQLPRRSQKRLANLAKRWLNTKAVSQMSVQLLESRDPNGEVISWLKAIRRMAKGNI